MCLGLVGASICGDVYGLEAGLVGAFFCLTKLVVKFAHAQPSHVLIMYDASSAIFKHIDVPYV